MKPSPFARRCMQWPLLCLIVGTCMAPPFDPQDRYAALKPGMTREPTGFAVFSYDKLLRYSSLENSRAKPDWPLHEGMSVSQVRKILGHPSKACAGEYFTESYAHWFCYKNDLLISKERKLPSF